MYGLRRCSRRSSLSGIAAKDLRGLATTWVMGDIFAHGRPTHWSKEGWRRACRRCDCLSCAHRRSVGADLSPPPSRGRGSSFGRHSPCYHYYHLVVSRRLACCEPAQACNTSVFVSVRPSTPAAQDDFRSCIRPDLSCGGLRDTEICVSTADWSCGDVIG